MLTLPRLARTIVLVLLTLAWSAPDALATELKGRVVGVHDGDTVDLLTPANV